MRALKYSESDYAWNILHIGGVFVSNWMLVFDIFISVVDQKKR